MNLIRWARILALPTAYLLALPHGLANLAAATLLGLLLAAYAYHHARSPTAALLTLALTLPFAYDPLTLAGAALLFLATALPSLPRIPKHPLFVLIALPALLLPTPMNLIVPATAGALILLHPPRWWPIAPLLAATPLLHHDPLPVAATAATTLLLGLLLRALTRSPANLATARQLARAGHLLSPLPALALLGYATVTNLDAFLPALALAIPGLIAGITLMGLGTGLGLWHRSPHPAGPPLILATAPLAGLASYGALTGFPPLATAAGVLITLWAPFAAVGWATILRRETANTPEIGLSPREEGKPTSPPRV